MNPESSFWIGQRCSGRRAEKKGRHRARPHCPPDRTTSGTASLTLPARRMTPSTASRPLPTRRLTSGMAPGPLPACRIPSRTAPRPRPTRRMASSTAPGPLPARRMASGTASRPLPAAISCSESSYFQQAALFPRRRGAEAAGESHHSARKTHKLDRNYDPAGQTGQCLRPL